MKNLKWLPILLLWCMVGVGCTEYYVPHDKPITTIKVHGGHCDYIVDNRNEAFITAPCGWYKIGDYPIRPLDSLIK